MRIFDRVKMIEKAAEQKVRVQKAKNSTMGVLTDLELERLENEERLQPKRDCIDVMKANIEGLRKLQKKAWSFKLSAFILAILSCLMTVAGVGQTTSLFAIGEAFTNRTGVFSVSVACLQFVLLNFNSQAFQVRRKHYKSFVGMRLYQVAILSVSVYGNYLYLHSVMPSYIYFSLVLAVSLDLGNVVLSNLANDVKYRIYSEPGTENEGAKSRFEKLLFVLNEVLFGWIDNVYNNKFEQRFGANLSVEKTEEPKPVMLCSGEENGKQKTQLNGSNNQRLESIVEGENKPTKTQENYNKVMEQISTLPRGTVINKDTFGFDTQEWRYVRDRLDKNNIVECRAKKTYIL